MKKITSEPASSVISLIHSIGSKITVIDPKTETQVQNKDVPNGLYLLQCTDPKGLIGTIQARTLQGGGSLVDILIQDEVIQRVIRENPSFEKDYLELVDRVHKLPIYM